jgi:hypothetical protein
MKVFFKMPWKQMREEHNPKSEIVQLESVYLALKTYSVTREDFEHIISKDGEESEVTWIERKRLTCIFEVYPDIKSYNRRAIPITLVKDTHLLKEHETDYSILLWEKLKEKKDDLQDFSKGEIVWL